MEKQIRDGPALVGRITLATDEKRGKKVLSQKTKE